MSENPIQKSDNPLLSHFEKLAPSKAKEELGKLEVSTSWYGGRRFSLPTIKGTISYNQVIEIAAKQYSHNKLEDRIKAINDIWKLNIKGYEKLGDRNFLTKMFSKVFSLKKLSHIDKLFTSFTKTGINEEINREQIKQLDKPIIKALAKNNQIAKDVFKEIQEQEALKQDPKYIASIHQQEMSQKLQAAKVELNAALDLINDKYEYDYAFSWESCIWAKHKEQADSLLDPDFPQKAFYPKFSYDLWDYPKSTDYEKGAEWAHQIQTKPKSQKDIQILSHLLKAAESEEPTALYMLACWHKNRAEAPNMAGRWGKSVNQEELVKASEYYLRAAKAGSKKAMLVLGASKGLLFPNLEKQEDRIEEAAFWKKKAKES